MGVFSQARPRMGRFCGGAKRRNDRAVSSAGNDVRRGLLEIGRPTGSAFVVCWRGFRRLIEDMAGWYVV